MKHFLAYYQLANDYDRRNELHAQPLQPIIEKVESLRVFDELNEAISRMAVGCITIAI